MPRPANPERTFEFRDRKLKGLPLPLSGKQTDYFDTKTRGLGLRISYGGRRAWFLMYTDANGKRQRVGLGEYGKIEAGKVSLAVARKNAEAKRGEVATGKSPAAEVRAGRTAPTVQIMAADFIAMQRKQGRKSADKQERMLARDVLPAIGDRRARDLTRADIKSILSRITERGAPIAANRTHEIIRALLNFGIEEEVYGLESNPADRLGRHRNPETGRDRWLTSEQIGAYWVALDVELPAPAAALRLCLLTAQRQGNVLGMRLDQISLNDRLWLIPGRLTKTSKSYRVPLSTAAVGIIRARIVALEEPVSWLFPKKYGAGPTDPTPAGKAHRAACKRAGIADYRPHDHRHTFATHCEQMGISRLIWDGIMGHGGSGMADLYSGHDFAEQRLACMEKWANRIAAALGENVVSLLSHTDTPA